VVVIKVQQAPAEHTEYRTTRMRRSFAAAGSRHTMSDSRTLGGHRRYPDSEIRALVDSLSERPAAEGDESEGTRSA
jgi:hypothetical protein